MITLPLSFASESDVLAAYRAAGGKVGDAETIVVTDGTVNCAGTPPTFFDKWTYRPTDQLPNLYKGMLDMREVVAVQAPSQVNGYTRLDVIQRELEGYEFVGGHAAEWYQRPENLAAFLAVCPSGYLVFLEKYHGPHRILMVVGLFVEGGQVRVGYFCADGVCEFGARHQFAVRRKLSV